MKKSLSFLLIVSLLMCCTLAGFPASFGISASAVSAEGCTLTSIDEETVSAVPESPEVLSVILFGSPDYYYISVMLDELSDSTLLMVGEYRFIYADTANKDKDVIAQMASKYSSDITYCYGSYLSMMWRLIADYVNGSVSMPVMVFIDSAGNVRDMGCGYLSVEDITGKIKSILGSAYIEPPKDPRITTAQVSGSYFTNIQATVDRINEIRYEACAEGIENPVNPGNPLTLDDYHPVVWSSELEKITRYRAAEAILLRGHTRPNGKRCFTVNTFTAASQLGENLAWNYSTDMLTGINQFYEEKSDWINKTGGQTGHYTSLISPAFYSVGVGGFHSDCGPYDSSLCCWLSDAKQGFDTTYGTPTEKMNVTIEVKTEYLSNPRLSGEQSVKSGDTADLTFIADTNIGGWRGHVFLSDDVTWTSSDDRILTVSGGKVTGVGAGTATVTASTFSGLTAEYEITVTAAATEAPTAAPTDPPTEAPTPAPTDPPTEAPTPAPTDPPTEAPTPAPTDPPTEAPTPAPTDPPTEAPTAAPTDAPPVIIRGDSDGDGELTILDATTIQRKLADFIIKRFIEAAADADNDGSISILDATSIQRHIAGLSAFEGIGKPISA